MAPVDTGRDRKRGVENQRRSGIVRERVIDHLLLSGGRVSPDRMLQVRGDFAAQAVRVARAREMRMWKDGSHTIHEGACSSLAVLLGEKEVISRGRNGQSAVRRTGVNAAWVLDIWEATLEHLNRAPLYPGRLAQPDEPTAPTTAAEVDAMNNDGPQVIATTPTLSLSNRILDAYLARNDEAMMRLAIEVEALEQQS